MCVGARACMCAFADRQTVRKRGRRLRRREIERIRGRGGVEIYRETMKEEGEGEEERDCVMLGGVHVVLIQVNPPGPVHLQQAQPPGNNTHGWQIKG